MLNLGRPHYMYKNTLENYWNTIWKMLAHVGIICQIVLHFGYIPVFFHGNGTARQNIKH